MARGPRQLLAQPIAEALDRALPGIVVTATDEWVEVASDRIEEALRWLHDSEEFDAAQLSNLTAVDRHDHFEVVYHLQSLDLNHQVAVKALVYDHDDPVLPSAYPVYKGALFQEREVYDLMGIRFHGHPDLRRLLLWEGFPGHPLRKDWMGMVGPHVPGLGRFPFEDKDNPVRPLNEGNLVPTISPADRPDPGAGSGQGH